MAQQSGSTKKRGPGRPPGSKNKPKNTDTLPNGPTRNEVIEEMKKRAEREKRNLDVIWSITLFAIALFLFFTVVMDTTGSFGLHIHNLCRGLFGGMALLLPFLVFVFACLLLAGKLSHIGLRTAIFSALIYINICVLNSARFIETDNLRYSFADIGNYYRSGVNGIMGGAVGMEIGSILAKLFGMPGLLIISIAVLLISVFLVANSPISRFADSLSRRAEHNRMIRELAKDEGELAGIPEKTKAAEVSSASVSAEPKKSFFGSLIDKLIGDDPHDKASNDPVYFPAADPANIPKPFGVLDDKDIDYTQIVDSPLKSQNRTQDRNTLFGRLKGRIAGIDSETGEDISADSLRRDAMRAKAVDRNVFAEDRNFERENVEDYGYPGRKRNAPEKPKTGYGLGDPDETVKTGHYGLDGHGAASSENNAAPAEEAASAPARRSKPKASAAAKKTKPAEDEAAAMDSAEEADIAAGFSSVTDDTSYEFPPSSLLKRDSGSKHVVSEIQLEERAALLERTLNDFGVDAKVINVTQGASVTRYEVQPAVGVKVSKITNLADDIALNMRAKSIRIEAPIPGKAAVGIEVENEKPSPVLIRDLIESEEFIDAPSKIAFVVGKDISGNNIVADLKGMPHMLIAGATGSGKSVCINSIITSFLYKAKPSELKLIMIDPKVVELGNYNGIPHLLTPVVTDPRKASRALAIAVEEMDKRYEAFAENNVKDLESYNEYMIANQRYADCKPQIVIIIDELADLMMAAPSEVENSICRLAQKARAAGMHLIVATQRPSVDVVTGLIKANIPSRIAFSVASQIDSRTILDMAGAEKLLGKGDMLFSPVGSTKPYRVQGPFISEKEIDKIIKFVKKEGGSPEYDEELKSAIENADKKTGSGPQDELTEDAIAFIFKSGQASVSMLQRRFRIGYNRAARIIDEIEEKGIIGPSDGSRPRQVLMTETEYYGGFDDEASEEPAAEEPVSEPVYAEDEEIFEEIEPEPVREEAKATEGTETVTSEDSASKKLTNTQAMNSFNSLPESVRRMVMDADSEDKY